MSAMEDGDPMKKTFALMFAPSLSFTVDITHRRIVSGVPKQFYSIQIALSATLPRVCPYTGTALIPLA